MFIVTLLTTTASAEDQARDAEARLAAAGCDVRERHARDGATDLLCAGAPALARAAADALPFDAFVLPWPRPEVRLMIADMDSTMITVECIDELADYAGVKPAVAEITERAMRGELDFEGALRARVALLAGLPETVLARCQAERVRLTPGAVTLVRTLAARGVRTLLVSGGFTAFAEPVAAVIGFDGVRANRLGIADGVLDGRVEEPILGAAAKRTALIETAAAMRIDLRQTVAIGDGANDIPMLETAGIGIAYHAKPRAAAAADLAVRFGDLTAVLHALGIDRREWHVG